MEKIESLVTGLDETVAKAETAAKTADEASSKADAAAASIEKSVESAKFWVVAAERASSSSEDFANMAQDSRLAAEEAAKTAQESASGVSGYADAAKASAEASAASATEAKTAAASIDVTKIVDLTSVQTVTGQKTLNNTGNKIRVANADEALNEFDVINSHDINELDGKFNDLLHRSGVVREVVSGKKAFPFFDVIQTTKNNYPWILKESGVDKNISDFRLTASYELTSALIARCLIKIKTPIGDTESEIVLRAVLDGSKYHYESVKNEVISNNLIGSIEALITVKTFSQPHSTNPEAKLQIRYTGDSIKNLPYAVELRVSTVTPGDISSTHFDWLVSPQTVEIPSDAIESSDYLVIPVSAYTTAAAVSAVSEEKTVVIDGKSYKVSEIQKILNE